MTSLKPRGTLQIIGLLFIAFCVFDGFYRYRTGRLFWNSADYVLLAVALLSFLLATVVPFDR